MERQVSRRSFLKGALSAVAGYVAVDQMAGDSMWNRSNPEILEFPAAHGAPGDFMTLITAGFNSAATPTIARDLYPTLSQYGRVAALIDSDKAYDPNAYYQTIRRHVQDTGTRTILLLDESMAPIVTSEPATKLMAEDNVEIMRIFDCSPDGFDTVKGEYKKMLIGGLALLYYTGIHGGPTIRAMLETVGFKLDNPDVNWLKSTEHGFRKLKQVMPSNEHDLSRLARLVAFDCSAFAAPFQNVPYGYIHPTNPDRDPVVNDIGAIAGWQQGRRDKIISITNEHTGHANPGQHPEAYNSMVHWLLNKAFELKTASERRASIYLQNALRSHRIQ